MLASGSCVHGHMRTKSLDKLPTYRQSQSKVGSNGEDTVC